MKENIVDVFNAWLDSRLERIHTVIPGIIESYNESSRKAKVKPLVKLKTSLNDSLAIPPIDNVPVQFPSALGFSLTYPLVPGDNCIILFAENGIGNYLNGQGKNEVEPDDLNRFALTDAICIPGISPFNAIPKSKATITVGTDGVININGGSEGVARKEDAVKSTATEDVAFWAWAVKYNAFNVGWSVALTTLIASGGTAPGVVVYATAMKALLVTLGSIPTELTSKISAASSTVKAG